MPKLLNITKKWGDRSIFDNFSLEIAPNKTTVIIGKSGVGKTTLLRIIAKLTEYEGEVLDFGEVSYVFQEPRLIPFLTIKENLEYALSSAVDKNGIEKAVDDYLKNTEIEKLKNKLAKTLSGGEKQRVSLIRAFLYPSETILLDEPFSSLDVGLKMKIIDLYANLSEKSAKTAVLVTHNIDEAIYLADEIVFLYNGGCKKFAVTKDKKERTFGYEEDNALRKELYSLFEVV